MRDIFPAPGFWREFLRDNARLLPYNLAVLAVQALYYAWEVSR